jgi:hypothetical protein
MNITEGRGNTGKERGKKNVYGGCMKTYWCAIRKIRRATVYEDWFNTFDEAWPYMIGVRFGK